MMKRKFLRKPDGNERKKPNKTDSKKRVRRRAIVLNFTLNTGNNTYFPIESLDPRASRCTRN